jgi:hypothetical protein
MFKMAISIYLVASTFKRELNIVVDLFNVEQLYV